MIDWSAAKFFLDLVAIVVAACAWLYAWASNRHRATRDQIDALQVRHDKRLDNHAGRIITLEEMTRHLPTSDEIRRLTAQLADLHGDFKGLKAEMEGFRNLHKVFERQVQLMDDYLKRADK